MPLFSFLSAWLILVLYQIYFLCFCVFWHLFFLHLGYFICQCCYFFLFSSQSEFSHHCDCYTGCRCTHTQNKWCDQHKLLWDHLLVRNVSNSKSKDDLRQYLHTLMCWYTEKCLMMCSPTAIEKREVFVEVLSCSTSYNSTTGWAVAIPTVKGWEELWTNYQNCWETDLRKTI